MNRQEEAILKNLIQTSKIISEEKLKKGIEVQEQLRMQGKHFPLSEILNSQGALNLEQINQLQHLENLVPGYTLWEKIGEGKWGIVYKAWQHSLNRWVSIKILNPQLVHSPILVERFLREIHNFGKLDHPNILRALDSGKIGELYYLITEYFAGVNLAQYLKIKGPLPEKEVINIGYKLAQALFHVWEKGMIHRDIIPENIMISQEDVKLCDLGLVRAIAGNGYLTPYPIPRRAYSYISPEQARGEKLDYRSDVYSLGAVLYFALTGRQTIQEWEINSKAKVYKAIPSPQEYIPNLTEDITRAIMQMLAFRPQDRCQDPKDIVQCFQKLQHRILRKQTYQQRWIHYKSWLLYIAIFSFLGLGIHWIFFPISQPYVLDPFSKTLSPTQLYESCVKGVVLLESQGNLGSGVILSYQEYPLIITNAHLVQNSSQVKVTLKDGAQFLSRVLVIHPSLDLALIELPLPVGQVVPIPMAQDKNIHVGEDVFVIGHPQGYRWSITRGTVSGIRGDTIQTDAAINPGNSGGPLLDAHGRMVGLVTFTIGKANPIGFAISIQRIQKFLELIQLK